MAARKSVENARDLGTSPKDENLDARVANTREDTVSQEDSMDTDEGADSNKPKEKESLDHQLKQASDRILRLQAEQENLRRRMGRQIEDERRYASMSLLRELLSVMDNMDRAIDAAERSHDSNSLLDGIKLVGQQLSTVLSQHQCKPIEAIHQVFDPNLHEAILQQPSGEYPEGTVIQVSQVGYLLHDRVVRPSQVVVATRPADGNAGDGPSGESSA